MRGAALILAVVAVGATGAFAVDWQRAGDEAIDKLQAYVRVDTTNPPGNETPAADLLRDWLSREGIEVRLYDPMNDRKRQSLLARLPGRSGRSLVLMSHSDVVPAIKEEWHQPPFDGIVRNESLYGRGTLDTKGLGILQLMTLVLMRRAGVVPNDDVLLLIEPDEEEAGRGMKGMLEHYPDVFGKVRMVLNEGGNGTRGVLQPGQVIFFVQTAEKGAVWVKLTAHGRAGHASVPIEDNAVTTMSRALDRISRYETPLRPSQTVVSLFAALADESSFPNSFVMRHLDSSLVLGLFKSRLTERPLVNSLLRTTISLTGVHGGYKTNVIPAQVDATLDCRIVPGDSPDGLKAELTRVVGDTRVDIELTQTGTPNESPEDPELMKAVRQVTSRHHPGSIVAPLMSSGVTDSAYFRQRGDHAYGFNPFVLTEEEMATMHGIDEHVRLDDLRAAVRMYYEIVAQLEGVGE
ncbi:MAG: M20/M25/M40 family metallo-hydrolase [Deltaproteobacteria bacterium]|nr:M20/M25/M40 family metallo-hydrolase [Deltaproteobacteria bacterium]